MWPRPSGAGGLGERPGLAQPVQRQQARLASNGNELNVGAVALDGAAAAIEPAAMGFNKRKMEEQRRHAADKEAAIRRATDAQMLEDAERLIAAWNERQAKRMPMLFSPIIGAAVRSGCWWCAARLVGPRTRSICARSTVTTMRQ